MASSRNLLVTASSHISPTISAARTQAFDILGKVEKGGYASDLLHLRTAEMESRDV